MKVNYQFGMAARVILFLFLIFLPVTAVAGEWGDFTSPERVGTSLTFGHSYDPSPPFGFLQITGLLQYDYDRLWSHSAPEPLYFKVEGSIGLADFEDHNRLFTSVNILAQYYLAGSGKRFRPYVEAGIGLIYSDFQMEEQGLRINFNPQAGIGCDLMASGGMLWYSNFRIHHLSNGDLHHDNRGINSVLIQIGRYF